jgi:PAS domain S-box-containing protein
MKDEEKTKEQLLIELAQLRRKVAGLDEEITAWKFAEKAAREREERLGSKLKILLSTDREVGAEEVGAFVDFRAIQELMDYFYKVTNIGIAIVDLKGNILVATGWQDICTKFHRAHPEALKNCIESDLFLSRKVEQGKYIVYKCKNNMWDMATPIIAGNKHIANLFLGQFFFDDEVPDYEIFVNQTKMYGFDERKYLAALERVPRWSRETVRNVMEFYTRFAGMVSKLSYGNIKLARLVSEQKRVEEVLRASEAKYRIVADNTYDWEHWMTPEGQFLYTSPSCERITGYSASEFETDPKLLSRIVHPDDLRQFEAHREQDQTTTSPCELEFRIIHRDGTTRWIGHACQPVFNAHGAFLGRRGSNRDITEQKWAEEERKRLEQRLQQARKAESLGRMAGAIAHHFNNLLGVVIGNLELAMIDLPRGAESRVNIAEAMKASGRAAEISRLMLAYLGQGIGARAPIELSEVCREARPVLAASLPEKVHLKMELPSARPVIRADAAQIGQVLTNLVVNAAEAMGDSEGDVTVAIHVTPATDIRGSRFYPPEWEPKEESYVCLSVSDTGTGMDQETLEKAFDPFFSTKFTGRGLGLAVVLGVVKAHEGALTVESAPGRGSVFRVFLPLAAQELQPPRKAESGVT